MAIIPKFQSSATPDSVPAVRLQDSGSPEAFGLTAARNTAELGSALQDYQNVQDEIKLDQMEKLARAKATDAANQFSLFATQSGQAFLQKEGADASEEAHKVFETGLKDKMTEYASAMTSPREQELFKQQADSVYFGTLRQGMQHVVQQEKVYADQANKGRLYAITQRAIADPKAVDELDRELQATVAQMNPGMPPEALKMETGKQRAAFYTEQINARKGADPVAAYAFYQKYKDRIDPSFRDQFEGSLRDEAATYHAMTTAEDFVKRGVTLEQALAEVDKVQNPEDRQKLRGQVQYQFSLKSQIDAVKKAQATNDLVGKIISGGATRTDILAAVQSGTIGYGDVPTLVATAEKARSGIITATNWDKHVEVFSMTNEEIAKADLTKYVPYLSHDDLAAAQRWQNQVLSSSGVDTVPAGVAVKSGRVQLDSVPELTRPANVRSKADKEKVAAIDVRRRHYLYALETQFRALPKDQQTQENAEKLSKDLLSPVATSGWGPWSKVQFRFEQSAAPPEEKGSIPQEGQTETPSYVPPSVAAYGKGNYRFSNGVWETLQRDASAPSGWVLHQYGADGKPVNSK